MYCEWNARTPLWEGDICGRLTPPPEDTIEMEQGFFAFPSSIPYEQNTTCCEQTKMEEEDMLLDLEFESICPGEFDGYKSGPTLAELNETRSRSPLINPEMKRLHQVAILKVAAADEAATCDAAAIAKPRHRSVLEQQLRTQATASVYHEQNFPSHSGRNTPAPSSVSRSEGIPIPRNNTRLAQSICLSPPSPQEKVFGNHGYLERKAFEHYQRSETSSKFILPQFENSCTTERGACPVKIQKYSDGPVLKPYLVQKPASLAPASHEQVRSTSTVYQNENCDESDDDDEDLDSDGEDVDDTEDYCPFQKEGKIPARRKGRKSESEDMVPNPAKLLSIGRELDRLNKIISSLKPINEVPQHSRGRSRREKNKLASRACRLKKKQQHEANKVKLHGLQNEQETLMYIIKDMRNELVQRAQFPRKPSSPLNEKFNSMAKKALAQQIAGHTAEFVQDVLLQMARGKRNGGLVLPQEI